MTTPDPFKVPGCHCPSGAALASAALRDEPPPLCPLHQPAEIKARAVADELARWSAEADQLHRALHPDTDPPAADQPESLASTLTRILAGVDPDAAV